MLYLYICLRILWLVSLGVSLTLPNAHATRGVGWEGFGDWKGSSGPSQGGEGGAGCGKDPVWDPRTEGGGSGLYRVRGKVGGRQTREIGHRLARPLAGLPSPRDLHTMERPQTPFTSDSSLLYYYNSQVKPACLTFYFAGWCHNRSRRNTSKLAFAILTAQVESWSDKTESVFLGHPPTPTDT